MYEVTCDMGLHEQFCERSTTSVNKRECSEDEMLLLIGSMHNIQKVDPKAIYFKSFFTGICGLGKFSFAGVATNVHFLI